LISGYQIVYWTAELTQSRVPLENLGVVYMSNRLSFNTITLEIAPGLSRLYYANATFPIGMYLTGLFAEQGWPDDQLAGRVNDAFMAINNDQLDGLVYPTVIYGTAQTCAKIQMAGKNNLFAKVRREGIQTLEYDLAIKPGKRRKRTTEPKGQPKPPSARKAKKRTS
jgi:hypothetical protein